MCNGTSTRVSQGGSIAVLHPTRHLPQRTPSEMTLSFSNRLAARGTSVELQGWDDNDAADRHWVVIHRDGDLTTPCTYSAAHADATAPLCSFALAAAPEMICLPQRLELGVGDAGIVGRRVSVMTGSRGGPLVVAQGIIGWN